MDIVTGTVELIPCKSLDADELARSYLQVFGRYGASRFIKSDNAKVFDDKMINQFLELIQSQCFVVLVIDMKTMVI